MGKYFFFCSCWVIAFAYLFRKMVLFTSIMGEISLWFSEMDNALLHVSGHYLADKIQERINLALSHTCLYLAESDDEQDNKFDAAKKFYISCGDWGSSPSLSFITVSVLSTSDVVCCWIFVSDLFRPNNPISSDDMVDWDNDSMLWRVVRVSQLVIMLK